MPKKVEKARELLGLDDNTTISILRYFDWNESKMEEVWFEDPSKLEITIGLRYDERLTVKYPEIVERLAENNQNMCNVMYMEFDPNDSEMKPDQLACGHQFSALCWLNYLQDKVKSDGPACVFTKCP